MGVRKSLAIDQKKDRMLGNFVGHNINSQVFRQFIMRRLLQCCGVYLKSFTNYVTIAWFIFKRTKSVRVIYIP